MIDCCHNSDDTLLKRIAPTDNPTTKTIRERVSERVFERYESDQNFQDDIVRATYAFHLSGDLLVDETGGLVSAHNWRSGRRETTCVWCGRSREEVRYGESDPRCQNRPDIRAILERETRQAYAWLERCEKTVRQVLKRLPLNGRTLAFIHETHGYTPQEAVEAIGVSLKLELFADYEAARAEQSAAGRRGFKQKTIAAADAPTLASDEISALSAALGPTPP